MTKVVNANNKRVIPDNAPISASQIVARLPYGPINGVETGYTESDIVQLNRSGDPEVVEESDRGESGSERLAEGSSEDSEHSALNELGQQEETKK